MDSKIIAIRKEEINLANEAFADLMAKTEKCMNDFSRENPSYFHGISPSQLEIESCKMIRIACDGSPFSPDNVKLVSGHSFPDIIAQKFYGVEVKSTKSNHWTSTGSSIVESTRNIDVKNIYMLFGKLGGTPPEFKCRPYGDVLYDIAVTHSPRYLINMELHEGETIFDKMNTTYDDFRTNGDNISKVREYYKQKAKNERKQEMPWWITNDDTERAVRFNLRLWNSVDAEERKMLTAYCLILFPEIWMPNTSSRTKYNQASLWLCSYAQVIFPNIRDAFTAGGKIAFENGKQLPERYAQVYKTIVDHSELIKKILDCPTKETIELIKEFNPLLLKGQGLYETWLTTCCTSASSIGVPLERWLIEHPKLECISKII